MYDFKVAKEIVDDVIQALEDQGEYIDTGNMDYELPDPKDVVFYAIVMEKRKEEDAYLVTGNIKHSLQMNITVISIIAVEPR